MVLFFKQQLQLQTLKAIQNVWTLRRRKGSQKSVRTRARGNWLFKVFAIEYRIIGEMENIWKTNNRSWNKRGGEVDGMEGRKYRLLK